MAKKKKERWYDSEGLIVPPKELEFNAIARKIRGIAEMYALKMSWRDLYELFRDASVEAVASIRRDVANGVYKPRRT